MKVILSNKIHIIVLFFTVLFLAITLFPSQSDAHRGARDELGGHFRSKDCVYLLHDPTPLAKSAKNINELMNLIIANNSNSKCVDNLSANTIDLEGHSFSGTSTTTPKPETKPQPKPETKPEPKPSNPPTTSTNDMELNKKYTASLAKCTDGDTANFHINGKTYKTRFLYIDTPESTNTIEPFGKEASNFTCSMLKSATKIQLETDGKDVFDKYDRLLAWIWVDGKLLQEEITKAGFVEDFYDYGTYDYEDRIISAMDYAKSNYKGMYASLKPKQEEANNTPEDTEKVDEKEEAASETESKDESKQEEKSEEKQEEEAAKDDETKEVEKEEVASEEKDATADSEKETEAESSPGLFFVALIFAILLFFLPKIAAAKGKNTKIAHRMISNKLVINIILGIIYIFLFFIIIPIVIIELILIFKKK